MVEFGRQVRQVKAGHRCTLKGLLRFVPGMRKSSKAKGYDHLITDEERRYAIIRGEVRVDCIVKNLARLIVRDSHAG